MGVAEIGAECLASKNSINSGTIATQGSPQNFFLMRPPSASITIGVGIGIGIENNRWQELTKILTPTPIESGVGIESKKPG
jgi:hypothetical protein